MGEVTFRKFKEGDLPGISEFRKSFFPFNPSIRCYEPEYYRWKCFSNPVQQGEMWLAESDGLIVGLYNITPKRMKVLDSVLNGAEVGDSFTHPNYQRKGILTALGAKARDSGLNSGINIIYGVPNNNSWLGHKGKLGYKQVPVKLRHLIKPMNVKQLVKGDFQLSRPRKALLSIAAFFSPVIKVISCASTKIGAIGGAGSNISISLASSFPDSIDIFWQQAAKSFDIMLVRSKDYLKWRFIDNPDTYSVMLATNKEKAIVGYMVTKVGFYKSVPVAFLVDYLTLEDNHGIFKKLLLTALEEFQQKGVSIVHNWVVKGSFYDKILLRFGFVPFSNLTLMCYQNEPGRQLTGTNHKWHFTMGDSDTI